MNPSDAPDDEKSLVMVLMKRSLVIASAAWQSMLLIQ